MHFQGDPSISLNQNIQEKKEFLIVSDTDNHCIRLICLVSNEVTTLIGHCGKKGHQDGLQANALLNTPKSLGTDHEGNIYIHDSGNGFIRKLTLPFFDQGDKNIFKEARLTTLFNGACQDIPNKFM